MRYFSEETVREICEQFVIDSYFELYMSDKLNDYEHIELPELHGRLIDADKLLPESGYDPMMFKPKYGGDHRTQYNTLMGYEILGIVEDAPTILEASK